MFSFFIQVPVNEEGEFLIENAPLSLQLRFMVLGIKELLGEETTETILSSFPTTSGSPLELFGRRLGLYSGLTRTQIKTKFKRPNGTALTDADVDEIFALLGVTFGTG
jgi:hypothetical protein